MSQKVMHLQHLYDFSLVRYEPTSIILINKTSRKPFEFFQAPDLGRIHPEISHSSLLRPILYKNGAMYERATESLSSLVQQRRRDYNPSRYSLEEIRNTLLPVIECLDYVHARGVTYGNLTAGHIAFFEDGAIYLRDWIFGSSASVTQAGRDKDMKDLGLILAEVATLLPQSQITKYRAPELISLVLEHYPVQLATAIVILLLGVQKHYEAISALIGGEGLEISHPEVRNVMRQAGELKVYRQKEKQKQEEQKQAKIKQLKEVQNQKHKQETPRKVQSKYQTLLNQVESLQGSPTKKFNINTPNKKIIRLEDSENKKVFNEEVKKRQIEKITKIIERSNAFVNQLMARKNDKKTTNSAKINSTILEVQENNRKITPFMKESPKIEMKMGSPNKRLRSISKKK